MESFETSSATLVQRVKRFAGIILSRLGELDANATDEGALLARGGPNHVPDDASALGLPHEIDMSDYTNEDLVKIAEALKSDTNHN